MSSLPSAGYKNILKAWSTDSHNSLRRIDHVATERDVGHIRVPGLNEHRDDVIVVLVATIQNRIVLHEDVGFGVLNTALGVVAHPSPLSAHRGFFGCKHFSQANAYLQQHGAVPVDWQLSEQIDAE